MDTVSAGDTLTYHLLFPPSKPLLERPMATSDARWTQHLDFSSSTRIRTDSSSLDDSTPELGGFYDSQGLVRGSWTLNDEH
jgi:hypothetical protein